MVRGLSLALLLLAPVTLAAGKVKVVVLGVSVQDEAAKKIARVIDEQVLTELSADGRLEVMGQSDISALLGLERQKQLMGCTEDSACLAEINGALGAPWVISGAFAKLGNKLRLDLKLLDANKATVARREGRVLESEEEVFGAVAEMVKLLRGAIPSPAGEGVSLQNNARVSTASTLNSKPLLPKIITGVGAVTMLAGLVVGILGMVATGALNADLDGRGAGKPPTVEEAIARRDSINGARASSTGLLAAGGVITVAGLVWLILAPAKAPEVAFSASADGVSFAWGSSF